MELEELFVRFERCCRRNGQGVSFDAASFDDLFDILVHKWEFDVSVTLEDRERLTRAAVFSAARKGPLTHKSFKDVMARAVQEFDASPKKDYRLLASVGVPWGGRTPKVRLDGASIRFLAHRPDQFDLTFIENVTPKPKVLAASRYTHVVVGLKARSPSEAYDVAMRALDFVRACWSFRLNKTRGRQWHSNSNAPLSPIALGPIQTLHYPNGDPAIQRVWFDPFFGSSSESPNVSVKMEDCVDEFARIRKLIARYSFGPDIVNLMVRHVRALDSRDPAAAFLELWSALEHLTGTSKKNNQETVKRGTFIYADGAIETALLEVMRSRRNEFVHSAWRDGASREAASVLNVFVCDLVLFLIRNGRRFGSLAEFQAFLDLSRDESRLSVETRLRQLALRMRSGGRRQRSSAENLNGASAHHLVSNGS